MLLEQTFYDSATYRMHRIGRSSFGSSRDRPLVTRAWLARRWVVGRRLYRFKFGLPVRVSIVNAEPSPRVLGLLLRVRFFAKYCKGVKLFTRRICLSKGSTGRSRKRRARTSRSSLRAPCRKSGQSRISRSGGARSSGRIHERQMCTLYMRVYTYANNAARVT